jgi:hypothetical protein
MLRRNRVLTPEKVARAWNASREARIEMRLLVGKEQEEAGAAYARVAEPLRVAYEETGNPGFAVLALRVLRPTGTSVRRSGRTLQYAHAPRWSIEALLRAVEEAYADPVAEARQRWHTAELGTRDRLFKELGGLSDREAHRVLEAWFGEDER